MMVLQSWYRLKRQDVMSRLEVYWKILGALENWNAKLASMTNEMENWNNLLINGDETERQKLLDRVTQEVNEMVDKFTEAQHDYHSSLQDLQKDFRDYCATDAELKNVVNDLKQEETRIATFNAYSAKRRETYDVFKNSVKTTSLEENREKNTRQDVGSTRQKSKQDQEPDSSNL
jgi:hypothetical protein